MIVFRSEVLPKPRAQTEMADGKVTKNGHQNFAECLAGSLSPAGVDPFWPVQPRSDFLRKLLMENIRKKHYLAN